MADSRIEKLAQLIVDYSVSVRKGDRVAISSSTLAEPLLKQIYARVLQAGGQVPFPFRSLSGNRSHGLNPMTKSA